MEEQSIKLVEKFRKLERLDLEGHGYGLTDDGVERIVGAAENLKYLGLRRFPTVTKDLVERLRIERPDLYIKNRCY